MQQQIARTDLLAAAVEGLSEAPVVALLGARQVGKTTLAKQVAGTWQGPFRIFDLEVASVREALSAAPERLLRECEGLVILDEVQRRARTTKSMHIVMQDLGLPTYGWSIRATCATPLPRTSLPCR